ncbi:MAG: carbohydrate kinase family protein [Bacilli bacterium]|nr:carbohydrate kinase family protein [Bacilli bacterium]MDD4282237.1 carbohydrate kinase family protein [Bacilli bacterium]MDD4718617.1 carbohydrate kinase family protein [Bacilli bacterium]
MKVLCLGHAAYDITIPLDEYPIENTKNRVDNRVECGGGPASNAAYLLGKWGIDVWFAGVVGDDEYGNTIKQEFESVNVNTDFLEISPNHRTTSSFIVANKSNGTRTILTYRKDDMEMNELKLNFKPDVILIDGQEYELSKQVLNEYKDAISIIDAGRPTPEIIELSKMVNHLACSKEFAEEVTGITIDYNNNQTIIDLYTKMEEIFKNNVVITLETKGCLYSIDGKIKIMPSIKVKAVDSTGAGDIFHGAFTYGIVKQLDFEKTLKISNIAGALSVTRIGGRNSVFSIKEMKEAYNGFE